MCVTWLMVHAQLYHYPCKKPQFTASETGDSLGIYTLYCSFTHQIDITRWGIMGAFSLFTHS